MVETGMIEGERHELPLCGGAYPEAIRCLRHAPEKLYLIGDAEALEEGLAVVGARRATPYGLGCASRFAGAAARRGITIISGGARGCDSKAHEAALDAGARTVAFLGGGCDRIYPRENRKLFQRIVESGGAIVSEHPWEEEPKGWMFRARNRLIAGLAKATLIVEAGLPSGTFSTADYALEAHREVLAVPGAITSKNSMGGNMLISQGAHPIIDDESFIGQLFAVFGSDPIRPDDAEASTECRESADGGAGSERKEDCTYFADDALLESLDPYERLWDAIKAHVLTMEEMHAMLKPAYGDEALTKLMVWLAEERRAKRISRYPDGSFGANVKPKP